MDGADFDRWTQRLGARMPRRIALLAAGLALVSRQEAEAKSSKHKRKAGNKHGKVNATAIRYITVKGTAMCGLSAGVPAPCLSATLRVPGYTKTVTPSRSVFSWGAVTFTGVPANTSGTINRGFRYGSCSSTVSTGNPIFGTTNLSIATCRR